MREIQVGSIGVITAGFGLHRLMKKYEVERRVYTAGMLCTCGIRLKPSMWVTADRSLVMRFSCDRVRAFRLGA